MILFLVTGVVSFLLLTKWELLVFFEVALNEDILLNEFFFETVVLFSEFEEVPFVSFELVCELLLRFFISLEFKGDFLNYWVFLLMNLVGFVLEVLEILGNLFVKLPKNHKWCTYFRLTSVQSLGNSITFPPVLAKLASVSSTGKTSLWAMTILTALMINKGSCILETTPPDWFQYFACSFA